MYVLAALLLIGAAFTSAQDNRLQLCQKAKALGITFYTPQEMVTIAKCVEKPYFNGVAGDALFTEAKNCVIDNSGSKAVQALSLYNNANSCLSPQKIEDLPPILFPPFKQLTLALQNKIADTVADCKRTNTQAAAQKQETCMQKVYGVAKAAITKDYIENVCTKFVNKSVTKKQWGCALRYGPQVMNMALYKCSKIVKA
ncbi:unnamed protein product [Caenorhabditis auriculariae]|uniref:DUF19 domain-containing protein n=1 Tax=Caenorhabditis auriculariae TaxID=2777116 RepID=A0A8S1H1Z3_9PELO|nr:unnamed protein product [Caenorhabditis auriculariae]